MSADLDPITMAVVKSALDSIVDEMGATVMRTARSPIVRDVLDYSATLCDRHGQIVAQAKTVALHIGAVPDAMAEIQARFGGSLQPGDVIVLNDPYAGGMHLPDIFMVKPIFHAGALRGYSVVVAHQCDMGGRVPGSNASDSTEIYQEGLRIPPLKLYAAGRRDETLVALIRTNVRVPDLVMGDIDAQLAACSIGEREFVKLLDRYGVAETERYIAALIDYAERMTRRAIAAWPKGTWRFEDFIDDDGFSDAPIPIRVAITVREDSLLVDYAGSSPQVKGAINSTLSFVKSATYLSVRCALDRDLPNNAGLFRCIEVRAPKGSILDPHLPAPVAARALTGYRVVDAMFGCLAQIVPDRIPAAGEGGNTVVCIGGWRPDRTPFIVVDMINGAWGGRPAKDGIEGVTNPSQNMSNGPVEVLEATAPIRIERYGYRPDSGGAGRWRGGLGLIREYRLLADEAILQVRSDRRRFAPWGLAGGQPGAPTRNTLDPEGTARDLPGKFTMTMRKGDLFRHEQAGGVMVILEIISAFCEILQVLHLYGFA
ncbi:MAG: hydantoinase B/oxoprolinase family protein [Geminicoccaceae bacterium]